MRWLHPGDSGRKLVTNGPRATTILARVTDEAGGRLSPRTRSILAWSLLGLGTLILLVSSLTVWVQRQALDTDSWVDTSAQLIEDDESRAALSAYIVDQLYENGGVQARLEQRLPANLDGLAAPLAGALRAGRPGPMTPAIVSPG